MSGATLLDLICRKQLVFNGTMSTEPIAWRVVSYLGYEHHMGEDKTPVQFATTLMLISIKYYKLTSKNPFFFKWLVLRRSLALSLFHQTVERHGGSISCLDLSFRHEYVDDTTLSELANACPMLTQCCVWSCHRLTDQGLMDLVTNCRYLTFLNFGACPNITNKSIECIGKELLYLDNLHLSGCVKVTDMAPLVPSRVVLQLFPSDIQPQELDLHHMKTQLRKFGCTQVSRRTLRPNNHELVLHFNCRPKAVGLWCELKPNKFMPRLTSADGSHHFAGKYVCTSLKVLNIVGCPRIADVSKLKGHHVQLQVLR